VIVATGAYQVPKLPGSSAALAPEVLQLHTDSYRNEETLPPGGVLVVGTGQSGCQVAEELHEAGRAVYLSVGSSGRSPRRYRGRDIFWWIGQLKDRGPEFGIPVMTVEDLPNPRERFASNPHVSGKNGGHDINLRALGRSGVTLLGHIAAVDGTYVRFAPDVEAGLAAADRWFDEVLRDDIDRFIAGAGIEAPLDDRVSVAFDPPGIDELNLEQAGIGTVIWATGYRFDFGWLHPQTFDDTGYPHHRRGISEVPGLYFVGLPWLFTQSSSLLAGVGADAAHLADHLTKHAH
jgi:putative flavoprotein involved in K+ transport